MYFSRPGSMHDGISCDPPVGCVQTFNQEKEEAEAKAEASAIAQEDLRAALMVKDKVLEDREKVRSIRASRERGSEGEREELPFLSVLGGAEFFAWRSTFAREVSRRHFTPSLLLYGSGPPPRRSSSRSCGCGRETP